MADLSSGLVNSRWVQVPGRPDQVAGVHIFSAVSSSDTMKVPALETRSASNDQSSARVLSPATGVTVNAGAVDSDKAHTLTIAGATAGAEVVLLTLHARGRLNGA